jgi:transposase
MGTIRTLSLLPEQRQNLLHAHRTGASHAFRNRCLVVLLKADPDQPRSDKDVGRITGMTHVSVASWLTRYDAEGLDGLRTRPGRGRKPILDPVRDLALVRKAVEQERQRLKEAKAIIEEATGKTLCRKTLRNFLKKTAAATSASV